MDKLNIEVLTLSGDSLSLQDDPKKVVKSLEENGCLVLKNATDLSILESNGDANIDDDTKDCMTKEIVLNQVSEFSSSFPHVLMI